MPSSLAILLKTDILIFFFYILRVSHLTFPQKNHQLLQNQTSQDPLLEITEYIRKLQLIGENNVCTKVGLKPKTPKSSRSGSAIV